VILASGKVYYDLRQARDKANANVAILRLEQFYPFPQQMLVDALKAYPNATEIVWVQEEPRNMGAWPFLHERLAAMLTGKQKLEYVGRPISAAPATGSHHRHDDQQKALVARALGT
jgi:2-oxoglutarate dehydrogenase complex dehydrogenase (E1) component-like enzyme